MTEGEAIQKLHGLVCSVANEFRGYLPHEGCRGEFNSENPCLSSDTRTRLAFIEDTVKRADGIVGAFPKSAKPVAPSSEERQAWERGEKIKAVKAYRDRTLASLETAYCAFHGITVEEYRGRKASRAE